MSEKRRRGDKESEDGSESRGDTTPIPSRLDAQQAFLGAFRKSPLATAISVVLIFGVTGGTVGVGFLRGSAESDAAQIASRMSAIEVKVAIIPKLEEQIAIIPKLEAKIDALQWKLDMALGMKAGRALPEAAGLPIDYTGTAGWRDHADAGGAGAE